MIYRALPARIRLMAVAVSLTFNVCLSQTTDDTRGLKPREYARQLHNKIAKGRPRSNRSQKTVPVKYVSVASDNSLVPEGVDVGITFWRLREARKADDQAVVEQTRIVKRVKGKSVESTARMTAERAAAEAAWSDGDMLRMSIEAPFDCFIYILNQERYADGTFSDQYLVFPANVDIKWSARGAPGKLVYVPSEPDYFEVTSLNTEGREKTAEVFTILLTSKALETLPALADQDSNRKVDAQLFEQLRRDYETRVWRFENMAAAKTSITKMEKKAGATSGKMLTESDPDPQTVYHVACRPGSSLLITVPVKIRKRSQPQDANRHG